MEMERGLEDIYYSLSGFIMIMAVISFILSIVCLVANWIIFKKAGKPGWHSIVPILNTYDIFEFSWSGKNFFAFIILSFVMGFLSSLLQRDINTWFVGPLFMISAVVMLVIEIMLLYYFSRSFGYGVGFFLGMLFFSPIFLMILAFGKAQYIGPKGEPTGSLYEVTSRYRQSEGQYGGYGGYGQQTYSSGSVVDNDPYHTYGQYQSQTPSQGFQAQGSAQPQQQFQSQGYREQGFQQQGYQQPQQQSNPFENSDYGRYQ